MHRQENKGPKFEFETENHGGQLHKISKNCEVQSKNVFFSSFQECPVFLFLWKEKKNRYKPGFNDKKMEDN